MACLFRTIIILLAFLHHGSLALGLYGPTSNVIKVTDKDFKSQVLASDGVVLVEFFANWCGHCKALVPAWEKAATTLKGIVKVVALDADTHKSLAMDYGIQGFPTIKGFVSGKPINYGGHRDAKSISEFALKLVKTLIKERFGGKPSDAEKSASVELTSKNFNEFVLDSNDLWLVEFFAPWCGHCKKLAPEWKKAAQSLEGKVKLGQVDCDVEKDLVSKYGIKGFPTILFFGADKQNPTNYEGARVASAIESFALAQLEAKVAPPEVVELTGQDVLDNKCATAAICFVSFLPDILDSKAEGRNKYLEILRTAAEKSNRNAYAFVWTAAGKQSSLEQAVGVGGYGYPAMVALNVKKNVYAPLRSAFEMNPILEFIREAGRGGKGNLPLQSTPVLEKIQPWDGKDAEVMEEEEFSLDEL